MSEPESTVEPTRPSGRRRATETRRRRPAPLTLLAVLLPLLVVGALALVRPLAEGRTASPPQDAPLTRATLVCPADPAAGDRGAETTPVRVGSADDAAGEVGTRLPPDETVEVDGARLGDLDEPGPVVLVAEDDLAPGLVAGRPAEGAATACAPPQPEQWFTGVGAGPRHSSVLELVNPDGGPAVADITVLGPDGPVEADALRGVTVPGGRSTRLDLAEIVPTDDDLALGVRVVRGRLGADVVDTVDDLDRGSRASGRLPGQVEPATALHLLGVGERDGRPDRLLTVANPGDDEGRVEVRLVTPESEFAPEGLEELVVPAGSVATLDLRRVLGDRAARDAVGLSLRASVPVTAALRSRYRGGDARLVNAAGAPRLDERAAAIVPRGPKRLLVAGVDALGVLEVVQHSARGREVASDRVELAPGQALRVRLDPAASLVEVRLDGAGVVATVETLRGGVAEIPLGPLVDRALVPAVRPALPQTGSR